MQVIDFIQKHSALVATWFGLVVLLILEEMRNYKTQKYTLRPEDALVHIHKGSQVIDIRDKQSYKKEHIQHAQHAEAAFLLGNPEKTLKGGQSYILCCEQGGQAEEIAQTLRAKHGYKLYAIEGGLHKWKEAGLNTDK